MIHTSKQDVMAVWTSFCFGGVRFIPPRLMLVARVHDCPEPDGTRY